MCGYDPVGNYDPQDPADSYDTAPVAPQMWHSVHMAGLQADFAIEAALLHRLLTGEGQFVDVSVHEACSVKPGYRRPQCVPHNAVGRRGSPTPSASAASTPAP